MDQAIASKIKQLRTEKQLTLKDVSEVTGFSVSYLSLIERGRASINLTMLESIAKALSVTSSYFFNINQTEDTHGTDVVRSYEQSVYKMDGNHVYFGLSGISHLETTTFEPVIALLLPGETREDIESYVHEGEEFYYVLEGRLTFFVGSKEYELCPGDSLHIYSNQMHNWGNFTNNIVRVLCVTTPKVLVK